MIEQVAVNPSHTLFARSAEAQPRVARSMVVPKASDKARGNVWPELSPATTSTESARVSAIRIIAKMQHFFPGAATAAATLTCEYVYRQEEAKRIAFEKRAEGGLGVSRATAGATTVDELEQAKAASEDDKMGEMECEPTMVYDTVANVLTVPKALGSTELSEMLPLMLFSQEPKTRDHALWWMEHVFENVVSPANGALLCRAMVNVLRRLNASGWDYPQAVSAPTAFSLDAFAPIFIGAHPKTFNPLPIQRSLRLVNANMVARLVGAVGSFLEQRQFVLALVAYGLTLATMAALHKRKGLASHARSDIISDEVDTSVNSKRTGEFWTPGEPLGAVGLVIAWMSLPIAADAAVLLHQLADVVERGAPPRLTQNDPAREMAQPHHLACLELPHSPVAVQSLLEALCPVSPWVRRPPSFVPHSACCTS